MHILITLFGILSAAAIWYYRLKMIGGAAKDVAGMASGIANLPRKLGFKRRAGQTGLKAVEDPREAAAIMMRLITLTYGGQDPTSAQMDLMKREAVQTFDLSDEDAQGLIVHAGWMVRNVEAPRGVMAAMSKVVRSAAGIGPRELIDLDTILVALSEADASLSDEQLLLLQTYRDQVGLKA